MIYSVELTRSAAADLDDTVTWIARTDSLSSAIQVLDKIQSRIDSLNQQLERGAIPPELKNLGIDKYREVFFKPYRIIYQIKERRVVINVIADGRRNMSALLQRRLTAPR